MSKNEITINKKIFENDDILLKLEDVLEFIPVSTATWYRLVSKYNDLLKPIKIGRGSFWKKSVIKDFVNRLENEEQL